MLKLFFLHFQYMSVIFEIIFIWKVILFMTVKFLYLVFFVNRFEIDLAFYYLNEDDNHILSNRIT